MFGLRQEEKVKTATNWNDIKNKFTLTFWNQNIRQFWIDEEIPLADDKLTYNTLTEEEKDVYMKILAGLTLLDTEQGTLGTPQIGMALDDLTSKAVLSFTTAMEHMHAKSYSSIFSTLCTTTYIDELFEWVKTHELMQKKVELISYYYNNIKDNKSLYLSMVSSVFLESFLFYSSFFYPLYMVGKGKLTASGEIINLIIRDESLHGAYIGILAQELFDSLGNEEKVEVQKTTLELFKNLYDLECKYVEEMYTKLGLADEVKVFIEYNADTAMRNLGLTPYFNIPREKVNAVVVAGLDTKTKNHDFFSTKGNGYIKASKVEKVSDDDFDF